MKFQKHIEKFDKQKIKNLSEEGLNHSKIAKHLNIPEKVFSEMVRYFNIKTVSKKSTKKVNHNYFKQINNENKAYILGFLIADGCVSIEPKKRNNVIYSYSKRIIFVNSIDDLESISFIKNEISPESKISNSHNKKGALNRKPQLSLKINSSEIVDDLIKMNINPRKTQDVNFKFDFNFIKKECIRHFIRGFFDGDGWISINQNRYYILGFVFTSFDFANQIKNIIEKELNIKGSIQEYQCKNMKTYNLSFYLGTKENQSLQKVFNYLYDNSNIFLSRKKNKFLDNTVLTN
jgi:intein/homing endonuclease